jgi:hypothetical protein
MLVGRSALLDRFAVDPALSYVMGRPSKRDRIRLYRRAGKKGSRP